MPTFCRRANISFMQHQMKLGHEPFCAIKEGRKTIESRLYDEKRQQITVGDEIIFSENDHPENTVRAKVVNLLRHPTFKELFVNNDSRLFGGERNQDQLLEQIKQFYSDEDEQKYGVVGIKITVID